MVFGKKVNRDEDMGMLSIGDPDIRKRMAESKKLSDNIMNVANGKSSITNIRDTLRKKNGLK